MYPVAQHHCMRLWTWTLVVGGGAMHKERKGSREGRRQEWRETDRSHLVLVLGGLCADKAGTVGTTLKKREEPTRRTSSRPLPFSHYRVRYPIIHDEEADNPSVSLPGRVSATPGYTSLAMPCHASILIFNARRSWSRAHAFSLSFARGACPPPPRLLSLNLMILLFCSTLFPVCV